MTKENGRQCVYSLHYASRFIFAHATIYYAASKGKPRRMSFGGLEYTPEPQPEPKRK